MIIIVAFGADGVLHGGTEEPALVTGKDARAYDAVPRTRAQRQVVTVDAAGNVAKKTGSAIKRGTKKAVRATKRGTQKVGKTAVKATEKAETKTE